MHRQELARGGGDSLMVVVEVKALEYPDLSSSPVSLKQHKLGLLICKAGSVLMLTSLGVVPAK